LYLSAAWLALSDLPVACLAKKAFLWLYLPGTNPVETCTHRVSSEHDVHPPSICLHGSFASGSLSWQIAEEKNGTLWRDSYSRVSE
jgi:hypothetical protein